MLPVLIDHSDLYLTNSRLAQLLDMVETNIDRKFNYQNQASSVAEDFHQLFLAESNMGLLFEHLEKCGQRLISRLYNSRQLTIDGAPKLVWDWSKVRVRGSAGSTGNFSKTFGVTQTEFQRRMRTEEDQMKVLTPKIQRVKIPTMRGATLQSSSWEPMMSLVNNMRFWSNAGMSSPVRKKARVDRTGLR